VAEQAARSAAEDAARRLRFLLESTTALTSSLDYSASLTKLARVCASEIADWAIVYGIDEDNRPTPLEAAHRDPSRVGLLQELASLPVDQTTSDPVVAVLRTGSALLVETVTQETLASMGLHERNLEITNSLRPASLMIVPMLARGRVLGAIMLMCSDAQRPFDAQDLALAEDVAARAALALDNARLFSEAKRANSTKADFLAVVSHDLRTPLNAIIGYTDLLDIGIPDPPTDGTRKTLARIRTSAHHLLYLLNELLLFARLDAGREELHLRDTDILDVARDVAIVIEPLAAERRLRLVVELPDHPIVVRTDPDKLRQILLNLVTNGVKYTAEGQVRLDVEQGPGSNVVIRVSDTGPGIAPADLPYIFEPFWQVDSTQRARGGGTGLGLHIVRLLVQRLGGRISVTSVVGEGSVFTLTLPRAAAS
jgi:signal transduction histidine kinase